MIGAYILASSFNLGDVWNAGWPQK